MPPNFSPASSSQLLDFVQNILKGDIKSTELKSQVFEHKTITISSDDNLNQELADNFRYVKFDIEQSISQPLHEYGDLYKLIYKIIEVEEPVHKEVITSRILELTGTKKAGSRIQAHIDSEIDYLIDISNRATGSFHENGAPVRSFEDFYFINPNLQKPDKNGLIRERASLSLREFDLKLVSPFEIWNSILYLIDSSYGITFDEIVTEVPKIFGYKRITEQQKEIASEHIKVLIGQRIIREEEKLLKII